MLAVGSPESVPLGDGEAVPEGEMGAGAEVDAAGTEAVPEGETGAGAEADAGTEAVAGGGSLADFVAPFPFRVAFFGRS